MITRKRIVDLFGGMVAVVALVYFARVLAGYWSHAAESMLRVDVLLAAAAGVVVLGLGYVLSAISWQMICRALGIRISTSAALHIYFVSQFGKYLPGNVGHHVGRLAMGMREGFSVVPLATSQFLEIAVVVATLSGLAVSFGWSYVLIWQPELDGITTLHVVLTAGFLLVALVLMLGALRSWHRTRGLYDLLRGVLATRRGLSCLLAAIALAAGNGVMAAAALYWVAIPLGGAPELTFYAAGCVFVISWLAGFVMPGAPAGLGVREAVMLALLGRALSTSDAVAATLVFRLATTITDLLVLIFGWIVGQTREKRNR